MTRRRVGLLISGGGSNMEKLVREMAAPDHPAEPAIVISNNPDAGGLAKAQALGVPVKVIDHRPFQGDRAAFGVVMIVSKFSFVYLSISTATFSSLIFIAFTW